MRANRAWEQLGRPESETGEAPSTVYRRLRREMLTAERDEFVARRDAGEIDDEILRRVMRELDLEEATLDRDASQLTRSPRCRPTARAAGRCAASGRRSRRRRTSPSTSPPGSRASHLGDDDRCGIHEQLRQRGFPGCVAYDCFGAGQHVVQVHVRRSASASPAMFAVLPVVRAAARAALVPRGGPGPPRGRLRARRARREAASA